VTVEGVDISKYQSGEYAGAGFYFVRLGAYQTVDPLAKQHVTYAQAHGIPVGGYWVVYEGVSGGTQAEQCYAVMQQLNLYRIAVDAEQFPGTATLTLQTVQDFVARMKQLNGDCGIYSGYWIKARGGGTAGADWGWLADYTANDRPSGWSVEFEKFWQYTSSGGTLDKDRYLGDDPVADWFGGDNMAALDDYIFGREAFIDAATKTKGADPGPPPDSWKNDYRIQGWHQARFEHNLAPAAEAPAPAPIPTDAITKTEADAAYAAKVHPHTGQVTVT
jgi:hypothetical protein